MLIALVAKDANPQQDVDDSKVMGLRKDCN
jgi:hypothetical protein